MTEDLFNHIRAIEKKASGKQKQLGRYALSHFEEMSFQTVSKIAINARVSEATVVRFAKSLGYRGIPQLKDEFQKNILRKLAPSERFRKALETPHTLQAVIRHVIDTETRNLQDAHKRVRAENLEKIAHHIINARRKYIVGLRASSGCAYLLGHFLSHVLPDVVTILDGDTRLFEGLKAMNQEDALVVVSYPRYSKRSIEALEFARERQAVTVALTDTTSSPAGQMAALTLVAPAHSSSFANSYTGCLSLINLLVTVITYINRDQSEVMLREWEKAIEGRDFFYKDRTGFSGRERLGP